MLAVKVGACPSVFIQRNRTKEKKKRAPKGDGVGYSNDYLLQIHASHAMGTLAWWSPMLGSGRGTTSDSCRARRGRVEDGVWEEKRRESARRRER